MRCMYVGRPVACRLSVVVTAEARTAKVVSVELTHPDKDCDCGGEVDCPCERFIPVLNCVVVVVVVIVVHPSL
jgi:hypothetical protein